MSDNKVLIQDLFASIAQEGWSTKFNDALADDLVWVATGSSPVAGTYVPPGKDHQASGRPPAVMAQACGGEHRRGRRHSMRSVSWQSGSSQERPQLPYPNFFGH